MQPISRGLRILNVVTVLLLLVAVAMALLYAPEERVMGQVQRIFYFHVPSALMSFLAFFVTLLAGIIYLRTRQPRWDQVASVSVEIGLLFTLSAMASGSIWARPIWNTWWTWDPRLTTYTIMALIYIAYLMLRQGLEDPDRRARFAAVYGIVGFISVPITYESIHWWRTIHPALFGSSSAASQGHFDMTPRMLQTFLFSMLAFTVLYFCFLFNRMRLARLEERVEQAKAQLQAA